MSVASHPAEAGGRTAQIASEPEPRLAVAALADRVDDVEALVPAARRARDHLGRVLEVGVHEHDGVAARRVEAGRERGLMAEVPREPEQAQALVARREARAASHEPSVEPSSTRTISYSPSGAERRA